MKDHYYVEYLNAAGDPCTTSMIISVFGTWFTSNPGFTVILKEECTGIEARGKVLHGLTYAGHTKQLERKRD